MLNHIHAALPPAASTTTRIRIRKYFNPASPTPSVRISTLFRRLPLPPEVLFQNNGGCHCIYGRSFRRLFSLPTAARFFGVKESSLRFFKQTLRFPTG